MKLSSCSLATLSSCASVTALAVASVTASATARRHLKLMPCGTALNFEACPPPAGAAPAGGCAGQVLVLPSGAVFAPSLRPLVRVHSWRTPRWQCGPRRRHVEAGASVDAGQCAARSTGRVHTEQFNMPPLLKYRRKLQLLVLQSLTLLLQIRNPTLPIQKLK